MGDAGRSLIYLHGRGSSEREAGQLPIIPGFRLHAMRAGLREGSGYAWFRNHSIGVADVESLRVAILRFEDALSQEAVIGRPWLFGFSNGAAMAAALVLEKPQAYGGLVMIGGCFAVDDYPAARLKALPVLFCQGADDQVIPQMRFARSWEYLAKPSGANAERLIYPSGHSMTAGLLAQVTDWLGHQANAAAGATDEDLRDA
jgi:phospholipase/carboxylesterase